MEDATKSEMMARRSERLVSNGYYDSDGNRKISYKETLSRIFRGCRRLKGTERRDTTTGMDFNNDSGGNGDGISDRNRWSQTSFFLKLFFLSFTMCFGLAYWMPTLMGTIMDSGPSVSTVSPTIMDLNKGYEEMVTHMRRMQDEILKLKRTINYLHPEADMMPNFALESLGAKVLSELTSDTYEAAGTVVTFLGISFSLSKCPKTVIQGRSPLIPGDCWSFAGGRGDLFIALPFPVTISHVTLGHIPKNVSPNGKTASAPQVFSVYGMKTLDDEGTQLGTFLYDQDGDSAQTFKVSDHHKGAFRFVKLQVQSNWGDPDNTCLYSFRVHGKVAD